MGKLVDLTGKKFGRLTAIKDSRKRIGTFVVWECICSCGNTKLVSSRSLLSGNVASCGCYQKQSRYERSHYKNITGIKFGRLKAVEMVEKGAYRKCAKWLCHCDCGNECIVSYGNLKQGNVISCGCASSDNGKVNIITAINHNRENEWVNGTYLQKLNSKPMITNTSGVKGVWFDKRRNKYVAEIFFQGKKHYLGSFISIKEAKKAREAAEQELWNPILEANGRTQI